MTPTQSPEDTGLCVALGMLPMEPLPLALGRQLAAPPLRGSGPSRSSRGIQGACQGVRQVGPGERGCAALLVGAGKGAQEAGAWGRDTPVHAAC